MTQPITLFAHPSIGPNPWKVAIILEELGLNYKTEFVADVKGSSYLEKNPNGR